MKRLIDLLFAVLMLLIFLPLIMVAIIGIKLNSSGPVFYYAVRVGMTGKPFIMFKLRTMHMASTENRGAVITADGDERIFRFGRILRKTKVDELPQLLNILIGDMSIVGPRPEDPKIVNQFYADWMKKTLCVRPGITSPGAIFYYARCENLINKDDPVGSYVTLILPPKIAIERAYLERATWISDLVCIAHTALAILGKVTNHPVLPLARDCKSALKWVSPSAFPRTPKA
jgi:lipopolysaccharide/colanic/teichoic acid biosynthesis glycosyltransferase